MNFGLSKESTLKAQRRPNLAQIGYNRGNNSQRENQSDNGFSKQKIKTNKI